MSTNKQGEAAKPMSGSITSDVCTDDIQVLSSEVIVIDATAEDDVNNTEQMLSESKNFQTMGTAANIGLKTLFQKKADKAT